MPVEEPKPKKYKDEYIIPGYGFRMLVGDIHHLIVPLLFAGPPPVRGGKRRRTSSG